jgi:hypothetical protein
MSKETYYTVKRDLLNGRVQECVRGRVPRSSFRTAIPWALCCMRSVSPSLLPPPCFPALKHACASGLKIYFSLYSIIEYE